MATEAKLFIWHNVADSLPAHPDIYLVVRNDPHTKGTYTCLAAYGKRGDKNVWHRYSTAYGDVVLDGIEYWAEIPPIEDSPEYAPMMTSSRGEL